VAFCWPLERRLADSPALRLLPSCRRYLRAREERRCCAGSGYDTTTYAPTINGGQQNNQYMDATDPLGNLTHYIFSEGIGKFYSPRETDRYIYQGPDLPPFSAQRIIRRSAL
jgi:hypothetical protein